MEDYTYKFKEDIEVPKVVMQKANDAFSQIRTEGANMADMNEFKKNKAKKEAKKKARIFKSQAAAIAGVCLIAAGSITAVAAVKHVWSRGMQGTFQPTEIQQQELTDQGVAMVMSEREDYSDMAVTEGGLTVAPETVIADGKFLYMAFSVSGYNPGEGMEPGFEYMNLYQGDDPDAVENALNGSASFYDGIVADENGSPVYDDGTALEKDADGNYITRYVDENGKMEFVITAFVADKNDSLLGKKIHVDLTNFGTVEKAGYDNCVTGSWNFAIDLPDVSSAKTIQVDRKVGETDFTLDYIELSPVSIKLNFDVNGEIIVSEDMNGIPRFCGVVLKDGTRLPFLFGGGMTGYEDETMTKAYALSQFDRVIDVDQVASLLFMPEGSSEQIEVPVQ